MPFASVAINPAWGAGSSLLPNPNPSAATQREVHYETRNDYGNQFRHLNAFGSAAKDVADFEILQQFSRNGRRNADDRGDPQHRRDTVFPETPSATISNPAISKVEIVIPEPDC